MPRREELTDEQWRLLEPFIPVPARQPEMAVVDLKSIAIVQYSMAFCGYCVPVPAGPTFPIGFLPDRPASDALVAG